MDATGHGSAAAEVVSESAPQGARLDRALARTSDAPLREGNRLELLKNGPHTYNDWLAAIARARRWVPLVSYFEDSGGAFETPIMAISAESDREGNR